MAVKPKLNLCAFEARIAFCDSWLSRTETINEKVRFVFFVHQLFLIRI